MARSERCVPSKGFPPIAGAAARILILGSLPGQRSLEANEYYAHAQNSFWRIMADLFDVRGEYTDRCEQLVEQRVAVWDVLSHSVRPGSMDADIRLDTARANDFEGFLATHPHIGRICFNGRKAEDLFRRLVLPKLHGTVPTLVGLPSTSPAYALLSFETKLDRWRSMLSDTK